MATDDNDSKIRQAWKTGSPVQIYSNSRRQWFKGEVATIFHDDEGEWLEIRYDKSMSKQVQRYSSDIRPRAQEAKTVKTEKKKVKKESYEEPNEEMKQLTTTDVEKQRKLRSQWAKGSNVEIFSNSHQEWYLGDVVEIIKDQEGEWLNVVWQRKNGEAMSKQVQRFSTDVRPVEKQEHSSGVEAKISEVQHGKSLSEQIQNRKKNFKRLAPPFSRTLHPSTFTYPATVTVRRSRKLGDVEESQHEEDQKLMDSKFNRKQKKKKSMESWKFSNIVSFLRSLGSVYENYKNKFRGMKGIQFKKITEKELEKKNIPKLHRLKILLEIAKLSDDLNASLLIEDSKNIDILNWDAKNVKKFIIDLKTPLSKYANNFEENGIDGLLLMDLDFEDLKIIGIASKSHQKKMLERITAVKIAAFPRDPTLINAFNEKKETEQNLNINAKRRGSTMVLDIPGVESLNQNNLQDAILIDMAKLLIELGNLFDLDHIKNLTHSLKIQLNSLIENSININNSNSNPSNANNHEYDNLFHSMEKINISEKNENKNLNSTVKKKDFDEAKTNQIGFAESWLATLDNKKGHRRRNSETIQAMKYNDDDEVLSDIE